jgi:hypothetical protein
MDFSANVPLVLEVGLLRNYGKFLIYGEAQ